MPDPRVTVIVPTLAADDTVAECLRSLDQQTIRDFETIVVDNSGEGRAARIEWICKRAARVIENERRILKP